MPAPGAVREDYQLLGHVYDMDIVQIDDKSPSKAEETAEAVADLVRNEVLYLSQLHGNKP